MRRRLTLGLLGTAAAGGLAWLTRRATRGWDGELALPLREFPANEPDEFASTLLVFLTSDSGWLGLNTSLPSALADAGVPCVGWNSLRYYARQRDPAEAAEDLERLLEAYARRWDIDRWAVVGYSFGSGVLPFLANRIDRSWRDRLDAVAYLAYPGFASFRVRARGWLLIEDPGSIDATEEVSRMPRRPSVCIAGEDDPIRACHSIECHGVERTLLSVGHGLHPEREQVKDLLLDLLRRGRADDDRPID